jgi:hypothetical protein
VNVGFVSAKSILWRANTNPLLPTGGFVRVWHLGAHPSAWPNAKDSSLALGFPFSEATHSQPQDSMPTILPLGRFQDGMLDVIAPADPEFGSALPGQIPRLRRELNLDPDFPGFWATGRAFLPLGLRLGFLHLFSKLFAKIADNKCVHKYLIAYDLRARFVHTK